MENRSFDDIIKSRLESLPQEDVAGAWELFEQAAADRVFDESLVDELDGYEEAVGAEAWAAYEASEFDNAVKGELEGYDSGEVPDDFTFMEDGQAVGFDALIGAKLASVTMDDGPDWEDFEKILDGDEVFDGEVKRKVNSYEAPLSESQWPKLSEHLEKIEKRRRRIVITKFVEAAIFILFIMTIMQLYPVDNIGKDRTFRTHGVMAAMEGSSHKGVLSSDEGAGENNEEEALSVVNVVVQQESDEVAASSSVAVLELKEINGGDVIQPVERETLALIDRSEVARIEVEAVPSLGSGITGGLAYERENVRLNADKDELFPSIEASESVRSTVVLASLDLPELEVEKRNFMSPVLDFGSKLKRGDYYFNMYGSPQANMINTPYDVSYSDSRSIGNEAGAIEAYSHLADGYSLGATISRETAAYEIEAGVEYTSLNYKPKQVRERVSSATAGYKEFLLKEIIFDIVEIPLNIKYNLFKKKGWKVYGMNGVSVGIVAYANYDIEESNFKPLASAAISSQAPRRNEESFVDRKKFLPGVFKDADDLRENTYATINVGMGVSKEISDNISFYVQPSYYHNLSQSGIGPNKDVHHRLALQIGTKVRI